MKQKYNVRLGQGVLLSKIYALIERANARQLEIEDITQKMNADITSINKMIAEDKLKRQKFKKKFGL